MGYAKHNGNGTGQLITNGGFTVNAASWTFPAAWVWLTGALKFTAASLVDLVTNGGFVGSAAGWTLGSNWAYSSNNVLHTVVSGDVESHSFWQNIGAIEGRFYIVQFTVDTPGPGYFNIAIGNNLNFPQSWDLTAGGTFRKIIRAEGNDETLYFFTGATYVGTVTNISAKEAGVFQSFNDPLGSGAVANALQLEVGGSVGHVDIFLGWNDQTEPDYTVSAGGSLNITNGQRFGNSLLIVVPSVDFNGTIDDVSLTRFYTAPLFQSIAGLANDTPNTVRLKVGGTVGSVAVQLADTDAHIQTVLAGAGSVALAYTTGTTDGYITIVPSADFNGTIDNVSIKLAAGGPELITNGSFSGNDGWVDKKDLMPEGWAYRGGSGNTGNLPSYTTSLLSAIARVQQGISRAIFVVGAQDSDGNFGLYKKSNNYTFALFRSRVLRYNNPFAVEEVRFNIHAPLADGMILIPVLCMDNNTRRVAGTEISTARYAEGKTFFKLGASNFGNAIRGKSDWFIEFQSVGEALCGVKLPVFADVDVDDDPQS